MIKAGIPYAETLMRLDEAFPNPQPGDLIPHEQLWGIIQPSDKARYYGVLNAWRKRLEARGLQTTGTQRARGQGLLICAPEEHGQFVDNRTFQTHKRVKYTAKSVEKIDASGFSQREREQHMLRRREVHAIADFVGNSAKVLRTQIPVVTGDGVRLADE